MLRELPQCVAAYLVPNAERQLDSMNPPTWLDERGQPRPKRPCPRCGREIPVVIVPPDLLKSYGWQPWQLTSVVEWCGHQIEGYPGADGGWPLATHPY